MGYPTVKSSPWKKGLRRRRPKFLLWSAGFWKRLVEQAQRDGERDVSLKCRDMIREMNELLYGI